MMRGFISGDREAVLRLRVRGPGGREETVEAVIDTGFNGYLTLPISLISPPRCAGTLSDVTGYF